MEPLPKCPDGSIISKCLTLDIWKELQNKKDSFGFTFKEAIQPALDDNTLGIIAGSSDSYVAFGSLYNKAIEEMYGKEQYQANMDFS